MKYSRVNSEKSSNYSENVSRRKSSGLWGKFKGIIRQFKSDIRDPLPGAEEMTRFGRIKARFKLLYKKYGWKLLLAVFCYYLIRDTILYIIIPYLIATKLIIN